MKLSSRTYTILDFPLSGTEFWAGVALCGALALGILFVLRPALGALLGAIGVGR